MCVPQSEYGGHKITFGSWFFSYPGWQQIQFFSLGNKSLYQLNPLTGSGSFSYALFLYPFASKYFLISAVTSET